MTMTARRIGNYQQAVPSALGFALLASACIGPDDETTIRYIQADGTVVSAETLTGNTVAEDADNEVKAPTCEGATFEGNVNLLETPELAAESLEQLAGVERIDGDLILSGELLDVTVLSCLEEITGSLVLLDAPNIQHLEMRMLRRVGGSVEVARAPVLETIDFRRLTSVGETGSMIVVGNSSLTLLSAPSLRSIPGELRITEVGGEASEPLQLDFEELKTIDDLLILAEVDNLETLDGFANALNAAGRIAIASNASLKSLDGLDKISNAQLCAFMDNPSLPICEVSQVDCRETMAEGNLGGACSD